MDELIAVRQLLAERPPPAPETMAAARASLERAGLAAAPGRVPLHLNGSRSVPGLSQPAPRRRWRGWLAPLAAAVAVIAAVAVALTISSGIGGRHPGKPAAHRTDPFAQVPRYLVALTGGNTLPDQGRRAVVAATATGTVLGSVTPPRPYGVFTWVAAAGNDRTFVLAAQQAQPIPGARGMIGGTGPARLYRLELHRSGPPGVLRPLRLPPVSGNINGFALSPDGRKLAVSTTQPPGSAVRTSLIQVFTLATGTQRSWSWSGFGWVGQDKPSAQSLVWAGDDRTLLFKQYRGVGGASAQIRLLDTAAPGGSLAAASTWVPFPGRLISGRVEDPEQIYGIMLLTADGHKIITAVARNTWNGRPGFLPQGLYGNTLRSLLPPRCRGTGRHVANGTPYCTERLHQIVSGGKNSRLGRITARQLAELGTTVTFTEFSAATAKPVATLGGVQGEGGGNTWAEVTWASPDGRALIVDGAWPKPGGHWPISHDGPPVAVAGVLTGGTFTPFPKKVQSLYFGRQATW